MKFLPTFLLLAILCGRSYAQNPGNVPGSSIWIKNDKLLINSKKEQGKPNPVLFNFNPITDREAFAKPFKNVVAEQYSLFFVFKSDIEEERLLMNISRGKTNVVITNKELLSNTEMLFEIETKQGIILSYLNANNDKNGKKRNSLIIDELFAEDKEGKEQLMELVYFPRLLSKPERQKVETYLSIKYGISIANNCDYLDSQANKIWNAEENSAYGKRITGLGRDDAYGLYQRQSGNSLKDGLYIGFGRIDTTNQHNKYILKDRSFLLWGDNGGKTMLLDTKHERLKKMERLWKMDASGILPMDSIATQIKINKKEFAYVKKEVKDFLWLCINSTDNAPFNYTDARYIRQSSEDEEFIYFNDVKWDTDGSGDDLFTFIQGPDFMVEHHEDFACEAEYGAVSVKLIGGTPPFTVNFGNRESITSGNTISFDDLQSGTYNIKATDAKGSSISEDIEISSLSDVSVTLLPVWYLDDKEELTIRPTISNSSKNLAFEWSTNGKRISTEKEFIAKATGDYTLTVSNAEGCKKSIPFKIEGQNNSLSHGWSIYPNPVLSGEEFSIDFNLENETEVTVTINSMEGKQILRKSLGRITDYKYQESIIVSGVYMVKIQAGNTSDTIKLIVR